MTQWLGRSVAFLMLVLVALGTAQAQPAKVTVGGYINDVQLIDLRTHSYVVDLYIWFRWSDPDINPAESFELMNIFEPDNHTQTIWYEEPKVMPDGSFYNVVRHQGGFSSKFPLQDYPFDRQALTIIMEDADLGSDSLQFAPDTALGAVPLTLNPDVRLPGYVLLPPELRIAAKPYPTAFGDLSQPDIAAYSRVSFVLPVKRPWLSGTLKSLIPVLIILLAALLALLIHPDQVEGRLGLGITALLTLVAMQFTAASDLPEVGYLMLIDKVYLASYLFILAVLAVVVRGSWTADTRDSMAAGRTDRRIGYLLAGLYVATLAAVMSGVH